MEGLNDSFYFVLDKLVEMRGYFIGVARSIAWVALAISIFSAAINYGMTGTGLKENIIKILKAVVFYAVILQAYPAICSWITEKTLTWAQESTYSPAMQTAVADAKNEIAESSENAKASDTRGTYGNTVTTSVAEDPRDYFGSVMSTSPKGYASVAPTALLEVILLTAGECITAADNAPKGRFGIPDFGILLKGLLCGFFVIFTGLFALLEYLIAYLEFMFVSSVGIILFPLSLWDGSKFLAEKFISALIGFFIKLLFCTICIFLALWGFSSLANEFTARGGFMGGVNQIVMIFFTSLIFFYICKSAPGLAQSLLTGTPSLNAAGAIGAAASAVGAAAGVAGMAARGGFAGAGALSQASAASGAAGEAVRQAGGGRAAQIGAGTGAFMKSLAGSGAESLRAGGGDLARSLMARPLFGGGGRGGGIGGGSGMGHNRHSATQKFLNRPNADGTKQTVGEAFAERKAAGERVGNNVAAGLLTPPEPHA
jgi:hypothetical protein